MEDTSGVPKIAVITGASRGLGRSIALHLAATGVDIVGTYRSKADEATALRREIESRGRRAAMLPLDVGRSETFGEFAETLVSTLRDSFGRTTFDFLVNNAGTGAHA